MTMLSADPTPTVGIVYRSAVLRDALAHLLTERGIAVVARYADLAAVRLAGVPLPDVLLVDHAAVLEADRSALSALESARALVFNVEDGDGAIVECVRSGAAACLLQDASFDDLVMAVQSGISGAQPAHPRVMTALFRYVAGQDAAAPARASRLTQREEEILALVSEGLSNKEIAERLVLQPQSVKNYVHLVLQKLGVHSRFELIRPMRAGRTLSPTATYA